MPSILDGLTDDERETIELEHRAWVEAHEPSPVDPDGRFTPRPGEGPGIADILQARAYRAEIARLTAAGRKRAG